MYTIKLDWKEFNINLTSIDTWVKDNAGDNYVGNSADTQLTLWYSEKPSEETEAAVVAYWDDITEESDEVTSYVSASALKAACDSLREGIAAKAWDDMSVAERKIVLGQMPTKAELGL